MSFQSSLLSRTLTCLLVLSLGMPAYAQDEATQPVVDSPLAIEPSTTNEYIKAVLLMVQLARPELAKTYLQQMLKLNPTDAELLVAREEYGTGTFLSLSNLKSLQPESITLLNLLNRATINRAKEPGYVDRIIPMLSGDSREREEAFTELSNLGPYAIPTMLQVLQNDVSTDRDVLIYTMSRLGVDVVPPMIGALQSPDLVVRAAAAEVLGWNGSADSVYWLWNPAFSENQSVGVKSVSREALGRIMYGKPRFSSRVDSYGAVRKLTETAIAHLSDSYKWSDLYGGNDQVSIWTWSNDTNTVEEHVVSRRAASLHYAERLAREAADLSPSDATAPVVLLATLLTRDTEAAGWDQPVPRGPGTAFDLAVSAGPEMCESVLNFSLKHDVTAAAQAVLQAMALNGSATLLGKPDSSIIASLNHASPRVQYAAAITILQWQPKKTFPHSNRIVEILTRAINSDSRADTVIMDPNTQRGAETSGMFSELGYDSTLTRTGMEGFLQATKRGDVELAVLHPNVIRWELTQTIANLRADARTRNLPVVIYAPAGLREQFDGITQQYQQVLFINQAGSASEVIKELSPALAMFSPPPLTQQQRTGQIQEAAFWLKRIASYNTKVFDITSAEEALATALTNPQISRDALIAYGTIGRPAVQGRLLQLVNSTSDNSEMRELAALQLGYHIQNYGNMLSKEELGAVKVAWENEADPLVKTALSGVIGSLKPTAQGARNEVMAYPASAAPIGAKASSATTVPAQ